MNAVLLILISCLSGCVSVNDSKVSDTIPQWVDPDTLLEKESLYCYKTLADYNCYPNPQRNQIGRLEGYYGPPPP